MLTYALLGYGQRGKFYVEAMMQHKETELVAVCDFNEKKLKFAQKKYNLGEENCYLSDEAFFQKGKIADLLFIATMDQYHYAEAEIALKLGYDLVLEKPIARTEEQCRELERLAESLHRRVYVCHVLRYAPIYTSIKEMLDSGRFGDVVSISSTEYVGWWHQAHSYVRGNWRNTKETTPMIVAKCCHDLDLLVWLIGKNCKTVSSFGSLTFFNRENAPEGCADYCFKCKYRETCLYNCIKFYTRCPDFAFASGRYLGDPNDKQAIEQCFSDESNPYARCVFKCDNDAVDHQVVDLLFEDGVTAQLTMTAFCEGGIRTMKLYCTKGEIEASMLDNNIKYSIFNPDRPDKPERKEFHVSVGETFGGHGGGDERMIDDIVDDILGKGKSKHLTTLDKSVSSHIIGFKADESRLHNGKAISINK